MRAGGLDKLADIISPAGNTVSAPEVVLGTLQKGLKEAQAALESTQAAVFGQQVRTLAALCRTLRLIQQDPVCTS